MKITEQHIKDARKVYDLYWDSYQAGDIDGFAATLDENFEMIGTSESEICHSKEDGIEFFKGQMEELIGKVEMRNRQIKATPLDGHVLVNEWCDIYTFSDFKWTFYSKIRISTVLRETSDGWKVAQQHGSLPDIRVQEGETLAIEKISKENMELRDAIKRRTEELEQKNRELEIEAALERVRARSMAMHKSEELVEVVRQIGHELKEMGIEVHNSHIWTDISLGPTGSINIWIHVEGQSYLEKFHFPLSDHPIDSELNEAIDKGQAFFAGTYSKSEAAPYFRYAFKETDLKKIPQERKDIILNAPGWTRFTVVLEESCLHFGRFNLNEFTENEKDIFKRLGKVFGQAYTRFLDLQRAEEQAREAEIEAALERVRARSMGMHHSTELIEVVRLLDREIKGLGIQNVDATQIATDLSDPDEGVNIWIKVEEMNYLKKFHVPFIDHPSIPKLFKASRKKENFYTEKYSKAEKNRLFRLLFKYSDFRSIPEERKEVLLNSPGLVRSTVIHKNSALIFQHNGLDEFSEEHNAIFKRFGVVFEQTYTRFLDLQKAEEQAREAQIEAALERIRSRSLAMHKTDELQDVVRVVAEELKNTGVILDTGGAVICTYFQDSKDVIHWTATEDPAHPSVPYLLPYFEDELFDEAWASKNRGDDYFAKEFSYDVKNSFWKYAFEHSDYRQLPDEYKKIILESESHGLAWAWSENSAIMIPSIQGDLPSEEEKKILIRFAKVFEQSFIRFLDLQKAEAQAREAEIQLALERVRARTMAMHDSEELAETSAVLFEQMKLLGVTPERMNVCLVKEDSNELEIWSTDQDGVEINHQFTASFDEQTTGKKAYEAWKKGLKSATITLTGDELSEWVTYVREEMNMDIREESLKDQRIHTLATFSHGMLITTTNEPLPPDSIKLMERFAEVFNLTYTRFLDLKKAEEQAREAQIEASLERVRARSMAMQNSDELNDVLSVLFRQFDVLDIQPVTAFLSLFDIEKNTFTYRSTSKAGNRMQTQQVVDLDSLEIWKDLSEKWKNDKQDSMEVIFYPPEVIEELFGLLDETFSAMPEKERLTSSDFPEGGYAVHGYCKFGYLGYNHHRPPTDEEKEILIKFAKEFGRVYQRFLDIQKAEEQARESEVQLALERVRARTMAMHNSDELGDVASVLFEQISTLTSTPDRFNIAIANEADESFDIFITDQNGFEIKNRFEADIKGSPVLAEAFENWKNDAPHLIQDIHGKELENWIRYMGDIVGIPFNMEQVKEHRFLSSVFFSHGFIGITTHEKPDFEIIHLLERFSQVFQQTYIRFLDLQKAEEQAREAKIETALEKVRSRTMGMQSSEELPEVANLMFLEVQALGIPAWSCGYCILLDDGKSSTCIMSSEGTLQKPFMLPHSGEASFIEWDDFVQSDETFFTQELGGKAIESHYNFMKSLPQLTPVFRELEEAGLSLPTYQINHLCKISHGFLLFITYEQVPDAHDIFKRFTNVFEQTYTRFLDLKKAEKLALETARQSSLDRIRAEIGSMRSAEDLQQITPLIWDELKTLEIPFIRCGVFIMDEDEEVSHTYLSTPQGESIAVMNLPLEGITQTENIFESWKKQEIYTEHWGKGGFKEWTQDLIDRGIIDSKEKYEAGSAPEKLDLHFIPFKHGMLYIGNTERLPREKLALGQSMADAFSVAYDRYEDFNKLEQAKQKIEEAFEELEAAKDQLVQQEKLASLGQLTAGIAHEIKNPLNFVNNFSDLSIELVEEARDEVKASMKSPFEGGKDGEAGQGDDLTSDAEIEYPSSNTPLNPLSRGDFILDILNDIEMNLKKIHEHGTRADGIVKSMLQHSRGGSGKMEPTDVNALIKEYANLAFHGMRAGKDPINVDIELDLDENVGEVKMIGEDFSRVILNLCNNAFDAMRSLGAEQAAQDESYEPKLTVRTHKKDQAIIIEIQDNGPGIPDDIKDKILQPFFTTKKGTAGTGLGLSITNDIIKAHGGELNVKTAPSEGTIFTIHLKPQK